MQKPFFYLALIAILAACGSANQPAPSTATEFIEVHPDGFGFRTAKTHAPFFPVGVNYDHDAAGRLLEDYWLTEWGRVENDFRNIAALGFNVVRVHLQFNQFMDGPAAIHEESFRQLAKLVELSRRRGLYLDLTGLAHYRQADIPPWFLALDDEQMAEAEANFWKQIAARFRDEPAIFCYDLQNEPLIASSDTREIVGPPFVGVEGVYHFINLHDREISRHWTRWVAARYGDETRLRAQWPDYPRRGEDFLHLGLPGAADRERNRDFLTFIGERAVKWTRQMTAAIRAQDRRHLITIGSLPGVEPFFESHYSPFSPHVLGGLLDFVSIHLHLGDAPGENDPATSEMALRAAYVGKPVVIEELSMLVPAEIQDRFLRRSRESASGYLGYYWGRTPAELRASGTMRDAITAGQIDAFSRLAGELGHTLARRRVGDQTMRASILELRLSAELRARCRRTFADQVRAGRYVDFRLSP